MQNGFSSLTTANPEAGLQLAGQLATELCADLERCNVPVPRPGGMNYLVPATFPKEMVAAVLFYAIATANRGWGEKA